MEIEDVRKLVHAEPFQPFFIHMADGDKIPVRHPDFIAMVPDGSQLIVIYGEKPGEWGIVDSGAITRLSGGAQNGMAADR